nr:hypothetical protein [Chromobacterium sp. ASV5]
MRHFTNFGFFLLGIVIAFYACIAFAIEGPLTGPKSAGVSANVFTSPPHPINTTYYEVDKAYVKTSDSKAVTIAREIPINIYDDLAKKEIRARVIEATKVSKPAMITAAKTILKRGARGPAGIVAPYVAEWAVKQGWEWMNSSRQWLKSENAENTIYKNISEVPEHPGFSFSCSQVRASTLSDCYAGASKLLCGHAGGPLKFSNHKPPYVRFWCVSNPDPNSTSLELGNFVANPGIPNSSFPTQKSPATESDIDSAANSFELPRLAEDLLKSQQPVEYSRESLQFSETPRSEPVTKKETTKNPDGSTTTKVTTTTNTYNFEGDIIAKNSSTKTTTTTTKPDGTTSTETSTTETQGEKPEPPPQWSDSEMPEVKELYKQKYPDGIKGIWLKKQGELSQTAFIRSLQTLAPSISGGTCPQFSIDTNNGWVSAGVLVFPVPCWIFDFLRAVILLTAAFVARMIVFGG